VYYLSIISGIKRQVIFIDLKKFIAEQLEYYAAKTSPTSFVCEKIKGLNVLVKVSNMVKIFLKIIMAKKPDGSRPVDVLVDEWSPGVLDNFYGAEFFALLKRDFQYQTVSLSSKIPLGKLRILKYALYFPFIYPFALWLSKKHDINLWLYLMSFFTRMLWGFSLKDIYKPKIIISGNDNNFPSITGMAAGCKIYLIQNSEMCPCSVYSFRYADILFSMGNLEKMDLIEPTGCCFKQIKPLGSIRLHNSLRNKNNDKDVKLHDVLWISDLEIENDECDGIFSKYYPITAEYEAIKLLNFLAINTDLRIAYKCRTDEEKTFLSIREMLSDRIRVIGRSEENTYETICKAGLILSAHSSVIVEAMGMGKKCGYVNLSGNKYINYGVRNLNLEFTSNSGEGFISYVNKITNSTPDYKGLYRQDEKYIESMFNIIKQELKK
jgi:hypothetical protein